MILALTLLACDKTEDPEAGPPLGMVLDAGTWAGAATVDITPEIIETFTDFDGDNTFIGCLDDPTCGEPFDDVDGDGIFEPVWIGGFGPLRPAQQIHDPISVRATVISHDGEYIAFVSMDLVGLSSPRVNAALDALEEDGFDRVRMIAASSHNHDGPDTMGLWGNPLLGVSGMYEAYQQRVSKAIEDAVREAAANMETVDLTVGTTNMRDESVWFNGPYFGGKNPDPRFHGMIHDGRDPVVISDQLMILQGNGADGTVFTLTNWSGHPETRGSNNNQISSDWVGVTRDILEDTYGGVAMHLPECLGGMQSALGGDLPLVLDDGTHVKQTCDAAAIADPADDCFGAATGAIRVDGDGDEVPEWAERNSWDFVTSHGWHIAEAAIDALADGEAVDAAPIRVDTESLHVAVENSLYRLLGPSGIFDLELDNLVTDPELCPEVSDVNIEGCVVTRTSRVQLGSIGFYAVPGELLPELAYGLPDDPVFAIESADPAMRGDGATYFPQHDPDCNTLDYSDCRLEDEIGDCACNKVHAWPYRLSDEPRSPMLDTLDTPHRAIIGMANDYLSYIIPEPDFNKDVSVLGDNDGDHYEDTVSPASNFATRIFEAQDRINARW